MTSFEKKKEKKKGHEILVIMISSINGYQIKARFNSLRCCQIDTAAYYEHNVNI